MAARGTGLPGAHGGAVTPLVDLSRAAGMADAAKAEGFGRLRASLAENMDRFLQPTLNERAKAIAAAEVEAGNWDLRTAITPDDQAYNDAVRAGALAASATDIEEWADQTRYEHLYDPDGYQQAIAARRSDLIDSSPGWMAIDVAKQFDNRTQAHLSTIRRSRAERDIIRAERSAAARVEKLDSKLLTLDPNSIDFVIVADERRRLQAERSQNPAFNYTPEQMALDDAELTAKAHAAAAARGAITAASEAGGGLPGQAAAYRFLDQEVLNNPALKDISPALIAELWGGARQQVDIFTRSDVETRRAEAEAERERRALAREAVGEWRLRIELDEATESDIEADEDLDDAQKASLVRSVRARQARTQREIRAEGLAAYTDLADQARSGGLGDGDIADAVAADLITPGQAGTLRRLRSTALRPIISNVISPVRDEANKPGRNLRGTSEILARAEADAATWATANPDASLNDQMEFGRTLAQRYFSPSTNRPVAQRGASGQSVDLSALAAERTRRASTGNPMPPAEYRRRRNEIINGR